MQMLRFTGQIQSDERSAVGVPLAIQTLGLQRKLYLTCLSCTKSCPDVAYLLEIIGPMHTGSELSNHDLTLNLSTTCMFCIS